MTASAENRSLHFRAPKDLHKLAQNNQAEQVDLLNTSLNLGLMIEGLPADPSVGFFINRAGKETRLSFFGDKYFFGTKIGDWVGNMLARRRIVEAGEDTDVEVPLRQYETISRKSEALGIDNGYLFTEAIRVGWVLKKAIEDPKLKVEWRPGAGKKAIITGVSLKPALDGSTEIEFDLHR